MYSHRPESLSASRGLGSRPKDKPFGAAALERGAGGAGSVDVGIAAGLEAEGEVEVEATVDGVEDADILRRFEALGGGPPSVMVGLTCSRLLLGRADTSVSSGSR